jgi:DNA-binding beta-propeller fold protein YncE
VSVYNGNKRPIWKVTTIPGTDVNEAMDISPDGKELWTSQFRGGKVAIVDLAARKVIEKFEVANLESDRLKFTRAGKRVLLSDITTGNVIVFDAATRKEIQRVKIGDGLEGINITPDGSTAYMASPRDNAVHIVDLKTMTITGHISVKSPLSAVYVP